MLEAALSIPSHEAQKWRKGVVGKSRVSPYSGCGRASSVWASKSLDMEYTFFYTENGRSMLLRKVCTYVPNYVTICPTRINVTLRFSFFCVYFVFVLFNNAVNCCYIASLVSEVLISP